jgi:hypothetical protein
MLHTVNKRRWDAIGGSERTLNFLFVWKNWENPYTADYLSVHLSQ